MTSGTAMPIRDGAPSAMKLGDAAWDQVNWDRVQKNVDRLQIRIAKAARAGRWNKVKALQWLLTHSQSAKWLAVKRVVTNKGRKTPGVDQVLWTTPEEPSFRLDYETWLSGYQAL